MYVGVCYPGCVGIKKTFLFCWSGEKSFLIIYARTPVQCTPTYISTLNGLRDGPEAVKMGFFKQLKVYVCMLCTYYKGKTGQFFYGPKKAAQKRVG